MTYFKAIQPNGTDFFTGTVQWAPADEPAVPGSVVRHPTATEVGSKADSYLSASTVATDCTGMDWPCRLLEVEPVDAHGKVIEPETTQPELLPNKRAAIRWRVVRELDPMLTLGPQAEQIVALLERAGRLTEDEKSALVADNFVCAPESPAWSEFWFAVRTEHRRVAWRLVYFNLHLPHDDGYAMLASRGALAAILVRDLIGQYGFAQEHYDRLTAPWRRVIGPIHPDDVELTVVV